MAVLTEPAKLTEQGFGLGSSRFDTYLRRRLRLATITGGPRIACSCLPAACEVGEQNASVLHVAAT